MIGSASVVHRKNEDQTCKYFVAPMNKLPIANVGRCVRKKDTGTENHICL